MSGTGRGFGWLAGGLLLAANVAGAAEVGRDCSAATVESNKRVARLVFDEVLSRGRIDENEAIYHPDFVAHGARRDAGRAEDRAASKGWREAVPDLRMEVLQMVAECDRVVVHWSGSGTNSGAGNGLPATGRTVAGLWGMTIFRIIDGRIREEWTSFDQYELLRQLGLLGETPATP
jgi:steroid delta-isomerase-like uncharacterized protein